MNGDDIRIRIENEMFGRMEKRYSEEEQANRLMSLLMDHYPLSSAVTIAVEPGGEGISVFAHRGLSGAFIKAMYARKDHPLLAEAQKGPVIVTGDDERARDPAFRLEHEYGSLYAAPCRIHGETLGVFVADSAAPGLFTPEVRESFSVYGRLATIFLALRSFRGRISRIPDLDGVTGLYTFKYFHEVLHRELMRGDKFRHPVSLLYLKIRSLRELNEVYGHVAADAALADAASMIKANLREVDYAARSGGMIHIVLPRTTKAEAAAVAGRIVDAMKASPPGKGTVRLTAAIGVVQYPKDGETEKVLIPHAEAMVHESMRKGGNAVTVYRD